MKSKSSRTRTNQVPVFSLGVPSNGLLPSLLAARGEYSVEYRPRVLDNNLFRSIEVGAMPQDLPPSGGYEPVQYKVRASCLIVKACSANMA